MDAGNIIYIIAIIAYFLYTILKKNKPGEELEGPESQDPQNEQKRPTSFEDLLKEIRNSQQENLREHRESSQKNEAEERRSMRPASTSRDPRSYQPASVNQPKAYEKFQGEVEDKEIPKLKTLDEQVSLKASVQGIKSSLKVEEVTVGKKKNKYQKLLQDPTTIKDAVILSEILNRKHF
jgi:serine phosphatase RsbU (regulator of sigma subunit)